MYKIIAISELESEYDQLVCENIKIKELAEVMCESLKTNQAKDKLISSFRNQPRCVFYLYKVVKQNYKLHSKTP
jgi:hypothetical protein